MDDEYKLLMKNCTRTLVPKPENRKIIGSRWILRKKYETDGTIGRYKARLVAQRCNQIKGLDYEEVYSPVVKIESFHILFSIAAKMNYKVYQMDVKTAYLNGSLTESIYIV